MQVSDFYYELPEALIAQEPPVRRGSSRMLVVSRKTGTLRDDEFTNLSRYILPGDCLVLNNTRVIPARLHGRRNHLNGALLEVFLLRPVEGENTWRVLVRPGKRVRMGDQILFSAELSADVVEHGPYGERVIRFRSARPVEELLEEIGETPLPPYIHRRPTPSDRERYQTVFAQHRGSIAAPTAGLHFTPEVLAACREAGAEIAHVTLHVGLGTFAPLRGGGLADIRLHEESFALHEADCVTMRRAKRLLCAGTTTVRTIESALQRGKLEAQQGETSLFIHPGYQFQGTGALLTNFHLPESSLLMLVAAFAGYDLTMMAYQHAVRNEYRFFSYGDCMLIE